MKKFQFTGFWCDVPLKILTGWQIQNAIDFCDEIPACQLFNNSYFNLRNPYLRRLKISSYLKND